MKSPEQVTEEFRIWADRNFPGWQDYDSGQAIAEEAGEVNRALLKRRWNQRGTREEWTAELYKEIGDVALLLMRACQMEGWSFMQVVNDRWDTIQHRNWINDPKGHGIHG